MGSYKMLNLEDRRRIEKMYTHGDRIEDIAYKIGVAQTTVRKELRRGYTGKLDKNFRQEYSAETGQRVTMANLHLRGVRRCRERAEETV